MELNRRPGRDDRTEVLRGIEDAGGRDEAWTAALNLQLVPWMTKVFRKARCEEGVRYLHLWNDSTQLPSLKEVRSWGIAQFETY